jgi:hypothetical protein
MRGTSITIELRGRDSSQTCHCERSEAICSDARFRNQGLLRRFAPRNDTSPASSKRTAHDPLRPCFTDLVSRFHRRIQLAVFVLHNAAQEESLHYFVVLGTVSTIEVELHSLSEPVSLHQILKK